MIRSLLCWMCGHKHYLIKRYSDSVMIGCRKCGRVWSIHWNGKIEVIFFDHFAFWRRRNGFVDGIELYKIFKKYDGTGKRASELLVEAFTKDKK